MHLAHIYLSVAAKMNVKRVDQQLSDFEYAKKTGDIALDRKKWLRANTHRFKRIFVVTALLAAIESVFRLDAEDLEVLVAQTLEKIPEKETNSTHMQMRFAGALKEAFRREFSGVDIASAGERAITKLR